MKINYIAVEIGKYFSIHAHANTHTHIHTYIYIYSHTHSHTHSLTHSHILSLSLDRFFFNPPSLTSRAQYTLVNQGISTRAAAVAPKDNRSVRRRPGCHKMAITAAFIGDKNGEMNA